MLRALGLRGCGEGWHPSTSAAHLFDARANRRRVARVAARGRSRTRTRPRRGRPSPARPGASARWTATRSGSRLVACSRSALMSAHARAATSASSSAASAAPVVLVEAHHLTELAHPLGVAVRALVERRQNPVRLHLRRVGAHRRRRAPRARAGRRARRGPPGPPSCGARSPPCPRRRARRAPRGPRGPGAARARRAPAPSARGARSNRAAPRARRARRRRRRRPRRGPPPRRSPAPRRLAERLRQRADATRDRGTRRGRR